MDQKSIVGALASAFLGGDLGVRAVAERGAIALGRRWRWLRPLSERYVRHYSGKIPPSKADVVRFLLDDTGFANARLKYARTLRVDHWVFDAPGMDALARWDVPAIESPLALADWLCLGPGELEWLADLKGYLRKPHVPARLRHYHYRVLAKPGGSVRLVEAPKPTLKEVQRRILSEIMDRMPAHEACHGFRKRRSIRTFVAAHTGKRVVLKMDLSDFFPSIGRSRIQALFRTMGYPYAVADLLGGLCTTITPREIWKPDQSADPNRLSEARAMYASPHLPQGAPTSPSLANLCAYRVDCRLTGLARSAGAEYTRYADDLAFSGGDDFARSAERFMVRATAILLEEGFEVHHRKTRIMRRGVRQQLAGLVVNEHSNIRRSDFDTLKAILTNCLRHGPASQNRAGHLDFRLHLDGRIGFVQSIRPERGAKLRAIFDRIDWGAR